MRTSNSDKIQSTLDMIVGSVPTEEATWAQLAMHSCLIFILQKLVEDQEPIPKLLKCSATSASSFSITYQSPYSETCYGLKRDRRSATLKDAQGVALSGDRITDGYDMGNPDNPHAKEFGFNVAAFDLIEPGDHEDGIVHDGAIWWGDIDF